MRKVERERWIRYFEARDNGLGVEDSAKRAKISPATAWRFERGDQTCSGLQVAADLGRTVIGGQPVARPVPDEAREALQDFGKFRRRYMGRESMPWQVIAANQIAAFIDSGQRDYVVINCPPGAGKSTLFTHDIPCWLIARNRAIRIIIGSRTERQAKLYVGRIRKSLERLVPLMADPDKVAKGEAFDAVATMADDYGAFKPEGRSDKWSSESLTVRQLTGQATDDKEPTVQAYGADSGVLGSRCDFIIWDDLVDRKNTKTQQSLEDIIHWWRTEGETRLEPGGTLVLQGQRIAYDDLYRHCLDLEREPGVKKYQHILYRAHDESKCEGQHGEDAPAWPDGCLLDPKRLPWRDLQAVMNDDPRVFDVVYQQNDGDKVNGLVLPEWINGGTDKDGYPSPGCLDRDRDAGTLAQLTTQYGLSLRECWSFVTVDPSPTEWWGVIWWLFDPATQRRYIVDLWRARMDPQDFLGLNLESNEYGGLLVEQHALSVEGGAPITDVVFEQNAAQRWFLTQPHVQRWQQLTGVRIHPHTTSVNKANPDYGVESLADVFRQGLIRIPYGGPASRVKAKYLIDEALRYPDGKTTDLVMSTWFAHLALINLWSPRSGAGVRRARSPLSPRPALPGARFRGAA